ncbi:MAG: TonB-dependent receptor domain-containing protein [Pseudomonadota bacterium]
MAGPAYAEPEFRLDIAASMAESSIKELAKQTGYLTIYQYEDVASVETNAIAGHYTIRNALAALLENTLLNYDLVNGGVITINRSPLDDSIFGSSEMKNPPKPTLFKSIMTTLATAFVVSGSTAVVAEEKEDKWMEEIVVTAEKREENILKVPVTMSAFNEKMIEQLGISADEDLENMVPGLQFGYDSEGNGTSMRGIGTQKPRQYNSDLAVTFYVDGIVTNDAYGLGSDMFDVSRVEVARGPQGTLNGRNSIAGSVNYVNTRPSRQWDVRIMTELTDEASTRAGIAVGGPMPWLDNVSWRLTSTIGKSDGWQENVGRGGNYGAMDRYSISPQLRYEAERFDINLRYSLTKDNGSSPAGVSLIQQDTLSPTRLLGGIWPIPNGFYLYQTKNPAVAACDVEQFRIRGGICSDLENKVVANRASARDDESERWALNASFELTDSLTLKFTAGDALTNTLESRDGDGTDRVPSREDPSLPQDCVDQLGVDGCRASGLTFADSETGFVYLNDEQSQELQLISNFDGPFNFVAGIFHYENVSHWRTSNDNFANPSLFRTADASTALVDQDANGAPDYANCQAFYQSYVLGADNPTTPIIEGRGFSASEYTGCVEGDNHLFKSGSQSGAATESDAIYANVEYRVNEQWNVALGLRRTEDGKRQVGISGLQSISYLLGVPIWQNVTLPNRADTWDGTIGSISVEYTPVAKVMYYGRVSTGFRAGGFNQISGGTSAEDIANNIVPATFDKEELINYEAGIKGNFFDDRAVIMAGAYYMDFDGFHLNETQQITNPVSLATRESPFLEFTNNIDGTKIWGAELEGIWYIDNNWRLSGFYAFLDSSVGPAKAFFYNRDAADEGTLNWTWIDNDTGMQMSADIPAPRDATGRNLPQQPKHKGALTLTYSRGLESLGAITVLTTATYRGHMFPNAGNIAYQKIPGYTRWDARAIWESPSRAWEVSAWIQNIADEIRVREYAFDIGWLTEPRRVGLTVRYEPQL